MDCKSSQTRGAKEKHFLDKYNAWKEKRQADQPKGSFARPKTTKSCFPANVGSRQSQKRGTVQARRQTFEIPANLRNSPIPLKMLPRIGRPKNTCDKENCSRMTSALPAATKPSSSEKDLQPDTTRKGTVRKPSKTSHSSPFIRQTKTSLARIAAAPGQNGDYLERFRQWKEERKELRVKAKLPVKFDGSSRAAGHVQQRQDNSALQKSVSLNIRRKTIAGNGEKKIAGNALKRRQTIANSNVRQTAQLLDRGNQHASNQTLVKQRQTKPTVSRPLKQQDFSDGKQRAGSGKGKPTEKRRQTIGSQPCSDSPSLRAPSRQSLKRKSLFTSTQPEKKRGPRSPRNMSQASMRDELKQWLAARGRTPSRCRHMMCYGADVTEKGAGSLTSTKPLLSVDELSQQQHALELEGQQSCGSEVSGSEVSQQLEPILLECLELLDTGCPAEMLLVWLDSVQENLPAALVSAPFWICRAKLTLASGDKTGVLQIFEEAVRRQAKPSDLLATELTSIVKAMTEGSYHYTNGRGPDNLETTQNEGPETLPRTPGRRTRSVRPTTSLTPGGAVPHIQHEDVFESSAIKYCVKEKTPLLKRMMETLGTGAASPCVITPVRRSTRRSLATIPESLREKDRVFSCVEALPMEAQTRGLYQDNPALTSAL